MLDSDSEELLQPPLSESSSGELLQARPGTRPRASKFNQLGTSQMVCIVGDPALQMPPDSHELVTQLLGGNVTIGIDPPQSMLLGLAVVQWKLYPPLWEMPPLAGMMHHQSARAPRRGDARAILVYHSLAHCPCEPPTPLAPGPSRLLQLQQLCRSSPALEAFLSQQQLAIVDHLHMPVSAGMLVIRGLVDVVTWIHWLHRMRNDFFPLRCKPTLEM